MKVILLQDVPNVGRRFEVKDVKDGLARNFLIPQRKAKEATNEAIATLAATQAAQKQAQQASAQAHEAQLHAVAGERVIIERKANEKGHLFSSIKAEDVAKQLSLPVSSVHLTKPIKEIGNYPIMVGERGEITVTLEVKAV